MTAKVHPTAVVSGEAKIGENTRVWHFSHVRGGARIGADCVLGQNVYVAPTVRIGRGVKIQNNVSLYDGVILEDYVFCGPSAVFTNVKNPRSEISRREEFATTVVRRGATIGANATVVCGVEVGEYAFIGAGATVTNDVPPFALMVGTPARQQGWSCRCGLTLPEPAPVTNCSDCGAAYRLEITSGRLIPMVALGEREGAGIEKPRKVKS